MSRQYEMPELETMREMRIPLGRVLDWIRYEFKVPLSVGDDAVMIRVSHDDYNQGRTIYEGSADKGELTLRWAERSPVHFTVKEPK